MVAVYGYLIRKLVKYDRYYVKTLITLLLCIYSDILESTMDTYSSIINNNMNTTMRTLTSISIVMMLPTLISSLFGMNLINGMEDSHYGFAIALVISVIVSALSWGFLRYKRLL